MSTPTVIGIDLSMTSTGLAVFVNGGLELENPKSKGSRTATWRERGNRLCDLANFIVDWTYLLDPTLVVLESPSYGSNLPGKHDGSGLWWMVAAPLLATYPMGLVSPKARAKYATGNGNSGKDVVRAHVVERYTDMLVDPKRFKNDDVCDATVLAAMGMRHLGHPVEAVMEEPNLDAMENVTWLDEPGELVAA